MHRLTRTVLRKLFSGEESLRILDAMRRFLDDFREKTPHMTAEQILPWAGWAAACLAKNESLRKDTDFLQSCLAVVDTCRTNNLYAEARSLLENVRLHANAVADDALTASVLLTMANWRSDLNQNDLAEKEYLEALAIRRELAQNNPDKFNPYVATTLNNLAVLHKGLNQHAKAEGEYSEALDIRRRLAQNNPDKFNPYVANTLNNLAILCRRRLYGPSKFGPVRFLHGLMHPEFRKKAAELREEAVEIAKRYPENPFCRKILASPEPGDLK